MVNVALVGTSQPGLAPGHKYAPNSGVFNYTDCVSVSADSSNAIFLRTIDDGQGLKWVNPGARIRFQSNAKSVQIILTYTEEIDRTDIYNGQGLVLVNGALGDLFTISQQGTDFQDQQLDLLLTYDTNDSRLFEIVLPYGTSVAFSGVIVETSASVTLPATPRSTTTYCAMGDSITQGLRLNTDIAHTWAYMVAATKGYQYVNMGYGGRTCIAADGTKLGNIHANLYSYLIGYNDFAAQESLSTFGTTYAAFITAFRALQPSAKLYCITPTPTTTVLSIPIESYRQKIRDVLTTLGNSHNVLVEGGALWPNNATYAEDGIHPNNLGSASMSSAIAATLVP